MGVFDLQESGMLIRFFLFFKYIFDFLLFVVKILYIQEVKFNVFENDINSKIIKQWRENIMYFNIKLFLY